jgi:hypothetical protein
MSNFSVNFAPMTGTDLSSGKRDVDLWKMAAKGQFPNFPASSGTVFNPTVYVPPVTYDTAGAVPTADPEMEKWRKMYEFDIGKMRTAADISADLTQRQLTQLYPYLSRAGAESTARSLWASEQFLRAKQQSPSTVQDIMASKQGQMLAAAQGEAERQRATAVQQEAASRFPGRFAGQYIQVG